MASVAVGGRVEVHQFGDATINERTDVVYVDDGDNVALLEKRTTVAEILITGVEVTVRASDQPKEQELDLPGTERIPENKQRRAQPTTTTPATATARRPAASINRTPTDYQHSTWQPSVQRNTQPTAPRYACVQPALPVEQQNPCHECLDSFYILPAEWESPWHKCLCSFYILWMFLLTCLGLVGFGYVGLGGLIHKCQNVAVGVFDLSWNWITSFVTGGIMVSFTLCVWLSCGAYVICCRERKGLCIRVVTGCGVVAGLSFTIAFFCNYISAIALMDISPSNGTLAECLPPHWLSCVPPFATTTILIVLIISLCCCMFCKGCFYILKWDFNNNHYDRF